jgi:hypothetical protein
MVIGSNLTERKNYESVFTPKFLVEYNIAKSAINHTFHVKIEL